MLDDDDDSSHRLRIGIVGEEKDQQLCNPILTMTGFGSSPCGACKFLRRKCADGCVFAPYFCHDQGAAHFAAIHKVFGASNVSKLLMQLPLSDRSEAALTLSYEAQARLQDPIYGCVSHIFALQQQVVTLEAQLASLQAQTAQSFASGCSLTSDHPEEEKMNQKLSHCQLGGMEFSLQSEMRMAQPLVSDSCVNHEKLLYHSKGFMDSTSFFSSQDCDQLPRMDAEHFSFMNSNSSCTMASLDGQASTRRAAYLDMEDLESVAFGHLNCA